MRALLLTFFASQNRSLFAAKCMVEVVIEMYRQGVSVDDVKVALSLAGLQHHGKLLNPIDEDILLNWVAVIMIALDMVGVPLLPEGRERQQERERQGMGNEYASSMGMGLQGLVRIGVDKFLSGTDLYRLQLEQSMAGQVEGDPEAMGESPAVRVLQQNMRLVIISLEVVRDMGLPSTVSLHPPSTPVAAQQAEGGSEGEEAAAQQAQQDGRQHPGAGGMSPGFLLACDLERLAGSSKEVQQRAAAVRLLISFMGAAMGWLYSAWDFVEQCTKCYSQGWPADEVHGKLNDEEFAQSGGMTQIRVARMPGYANVTALVLARWLSLTYITLAQLRVVFPGASQQDGWAWVRGSAGLHDGTEPTTLEAYGLADFVVHTIRNEEQREQERGERGGGSAGGGEQAEGEGDERIEGVLLRPSKETMLQDMRPQPGFVSLEDPNLLATSPTLLIMSQQISLIQMTRKLVLQERAQVAPQTTA